VSRLPVRLLVVLALLAAVVVPTSAAPAAKKKPPPQITVMSRNLFLGADLIPLALAKPGDEFEEAAGKLLDQILATEPAARMKLVAREIAKTKPDLVGLQEVTLWRTGPKNDPAPATDVRVDYLATIKK
jgi:hypothetical protein